MWQRFNPVATFYAIQEASRLFPKPDKAYILHIPIVYQLNRG